MKVQSINGREYKLPNDLNDFQLQMYVHLIDWKWQHITTELGINRYKGRDIEYDAILPSAMAEELRVLHPSLVNRVKHHHERFPFRYHDHFNHMAGSQAANINLFLPILLSDRADEILAERNPAFKRLAVGQLDHGWRIEYWDEPTGALNDKSDIAGTDSDLAIAYYDQNDELCLWLIEHKLTEAEFTTCGGYRSEGRKDRQRHDCTRTFTQILENKSTCYYHDRCGYNYWNITEANRDFFPGHDQYPECPFQGGMNQLWRNQLLGLAIEQDENQPYKHVHFSVVHHPDSEALKPTLNAYRKLIGNNPKFSVFTSADFIQAARKHADTALREWIDWYVNLYMIQNGHIATDHPEDTF